MKTTAYKLIDASWNLFYLSKHEGYRHFFFLQNQRIIEFCRNISRSQNHNLHLFLSRCMIIEYLIWLWVMQFGTPLTSLTLDEKGFNISLMLIVASLSWFYGYECSFCFFNLIHQRKPCDCVIILYNNLINCLIILNKRCVIEIVHEWTCFGLCLLCLECDLLECPKSILVGLQCNWDEEENSSLDWASTKCNAIEIVHDWTYFMVSLLCLQSNLLGCLKRKLLESQCDWDEEDVSSPDWALTKGSAIEIINYILVNVLSGYVYYV